MLLVLMSGAALGQRSTVQLCWGAVPEAVSLLGEEDKSQAWSRRQVV